MRVVMPFTPAGLDERAWAALLEQAPHAERVDVSGSPVAYWELLRSLWLDGATFTLVEHDVVLPPNGLAELEACRWPRCSIPPGNRFPALGHLDRPLLPFVIAGALAAMLQCNRWRSDMLRATAHVWNDFPVSRRYWVGLDIELLWARLAAWAPHVHNTTATTHRPDFTAAQFRARDDRLALEVAAWRQKHGEAA